MGTHWKDGYSAQVELYLLVLGEQLRISRIGRDSFVLRDRLAIPPSTQAVLLIEVDDHSELQDILLPEGADGSDQPVRYSIQGAPAVAN